MRRLGISLLLVVVIAIISAGWAVDTLFARLGKSSQTHVQVAEQLGYSLAQLIASGQLLPGDAAVNEIASDYQIGFMNAEAIALPDELQHQLDSGQSLMLESVEGINLYFSMPDTDLVLNITVPAVDDTNTQLRLVMTVLFYSAIAVLVLIWLYPLVRRLQRLAVAAKQFGSGDLQHRIDTQPGSQLYAIESEFNAMARRIGSLVDDNKMLSSAVSHDLRTPLARLRFGVDALEEQISDPLQHDYLVRISNDLTSMEQLVEVLLEFARLDQQLKEMPLIDTDFLPLIQQSIQQSREHSDRQITLDPASVNTATSADSNRGLQIKADNRYVRMLFNNLLQNAAKFSSKSIIVSVSREPGCVWLHVDDDGPGFPGVDAQRLLKPFEKQSVSGVGQGDEHTARQKGYGLGLAIVERIASWHGAPIRLGRSSKLGGARVSIGFRSSKGE